MALCPQTLLTLSDGQVVSFVGAVGAQDEDGCGPQGNLPIPQGNLPIPQKAKAKAVSTSVLPQDDLTPPLAARRAQIQRDLFGSRTRKKRSVSESDLPQTADFGSQNKSLTQEFLKPSNMHNKIGKKAKHSVKTGNIRRRQPKQSGIKNGKRGGLAKIGALKCAVGEKNPGCRVAAITSSLKEMEIDYPNELAMSSDTSVSPALSAVGNGL